MSGAGAASWLDRLVASHLPAIGQIRLAPMLNDAGRLMGDLSLTRLDEDVFWITGSYYLQEWHLRWFHAQLAALGAAPTVQVRNITDDNMGFSVSGPASREILSRLTPDDVSNDAFGFLQARRMDVGTAEAVVGRISLTGELGYEIVVPTNQHRTLLDQLRRAGDDLGLRLIGDRALDSLRLEKGYGIWSAEFRQEYTPLETGLDRFVARDKAFVGEAAARAARESDDHRRELVLLEVEADDADASQDEGVWLGDRFVGPVTSGAFGHSVGKSLALAMIDRDVIAESPQLTVFVIGDAKAARILPEPPYDPKGTKLRDLAG